MLGIYKHMHDGKGTTLCLAHIAAMSIGDNKNPATITISLTSGKNLTITPDLPEDEAEKEAMMIFNRLSVQLDIFWGVRLMSDTQKGEAVEAAIEEQQRRREQPNGA